MRKIVIAPLVGIAVLLLSACMPIQAPAGEQADEKSSSQTFPTGKYSDQFGNTLTFSDDGEFTVVAATGETIVQDGQYTIAGDVISINESENCPPTDGVYKWSYDDAAGILQLEKVKDDCLNRSFPEGLTRVP